jgi:hypothetical protein
MALDQVEGRLDRAAMHRDTRQAREQIAIGLRPASETTACACPSCSGTPGTQHPPELHLNEAYNMAPSRDPESV